MPVVHIHAPLFEPQTSDDDCARLALIDRKMMLIAEPRCQIRLFYLSVGCPYQWFWEYILIVTQNKFHDFAMPVIYCHCRQSV